MNEVKKTGLYLRLLSTIRRYWFVFILGIIGTMLLSVCDAGLTFLIKPIVDGGTGPKTDLLFLSWIPFALFFIILLRSVSGFLSNYCLGYVGKTVVRDFRRKVFNKILQLPVNYFDKHGSASMVSTVIYNIDQLEQASSSSLLILFREGMLTIAMLFLMFKANWQISSVFLVLAPLIYFTIVYFSRVMRKLSKSVQDSMSEVTHVVEEGVLANREVRIYQGAAYEKERMYAATGQNRNKLLKVVVNGSIHSSSIQLILTLPVIGVLYLTLHSYFNLTMGALALIITAMLQLPRPARRLTNINADIQRGLAATESVFALLDEGDELSGSENPNVRAKGKVEFKNVYFNYKKDERLILDDINFTVLAGKSVALVGHSGSGKSSSVNLLPRFYELNSGEILLDDININKLDVNYLRSQISYVSQNTILFNNTIYNNIAYAMPDVTLDEVIAATQKASLYEFILSLPEGFDTVVGDNGVLLSGGQRQRVAIARAILKDAPVLILDEATSALDTVSERSIQKSLDELTENKTTIMVAHRLSTIVNVDEILVVENGKIVESGNHYDLIKKNGVYANLYRMQQVTGESEVVS